MTRMKKSMSDLTAAMAESEAALREALARMGTSVEDGGVTGKAAEQARAHPLATGLLSLGLGAGVAWLAWAGGRKAGLFDRAEKTTATPDPQPDRLMTWEDEGGLPAEVGEIGEGAEAWVEKARAARDSAAARLRQMYEEGRANAEEKARLAADLAEDLAAAFRDDLNDLGEAAANRVAAAREVAWDAMSEGGARLREGAEAGIGKGTEAARNHPLAATALGLAAGAAVAAALPGTGRMMRRAAPLAGAALVAQAAVLLRRERAAKARLGRAPERTGRAASRLVEDLAKDIERTATRAGKRADAAARRANGASAA